MAKGRMIYCSLFEDEYFGVGDPLLRLLWIGLIVNVADDQGRMLDNISLIKSKVFLFDDGISTDAVENYINVLVQDGKLIRYKVGRKSILQIMKWWEYQNPSWAVASKLPAPSGWIDRIKMTVAGRQIIMDNWDDQGGFITSTNTHKEKDEPISKENKPADNSKSSKKEKDDDSFQKVWEEETGKLIPSPAAFYKMLDEFKSHKVTPEIFRLAIQEQAKSDHYIVTRPESVKTWAINLAKALRKKQYDGEVIDSENTLDHIKRMIANGEI